MRFAASLLHPAHAALLAPSFAASAGSSLQRLFAPEWIGSPMSNEMKEERFWRRRSLRRLTAKRTSVPRARLRYEGPGHVRPSQQSISDLAFYDLYIAFFEVFHFVNFLKRSDQRVQLKRYAALSAHSVYMDIQDEKTHVSPGSFVFVWIVKLIFRSSDRISRCHCYQLQPSLRNAFISYN